VRSVNDCGLDVCPCVSQNTKYGAHQLGSLLRASEAMQIATLPFTLSSNSSGGAVTASVPAALRLALCDADDWLVWIYARAANDVDIVTARVQSGFLQHHDAITGTSSASLVRDCLLDCVTLVPNSYVCDFHVVGLYDVAGDG